MSGKEKSVEIQPELIQNIRWSYSRGQTMVTAVQLDIFTIINDGQTTLEKVARALGSTHRAIRIFLDALVGMGLLGKARGNYKLTPESKEFLVKGEPNYMGPFILGMQGSEKAWESLTEIVKTGKPIPQFEDPQERTNFFKDLVKGIFPVSFSSGVILGKKLGVGKTLKNMKVLDLGCGSAPWSLAFSLADTSTQVVAVDFPEILDVAQSYVKKMHATRQYEFRPGDYHEVHLEKNAYDAVILGHICHMEGETGTRKLIKRSFDVLKPGGKLLVAEFIANDLRSGPELPLLFALNMLLMTEHGDVFTTKDLKRWMSLAGFNKVSAQAVQYPVTVMVGTK